MKYQIRTTITLLCMAFIITFAGCSESNDPPVMEKINIGLAMQPSSALSIIALEKGYFDKLGLQVDVREFPSGKRALNEGLLTGAVDVAIAAEVPAVIANLRGEEFVLLAATFRADNVNRIIARRDAGISKPADLIGKRIATQQGSAVHFFMHLFLIENGIQKGDLFQYFMKAEQLPAALETNRVDAFSMREPYISRAAKLLGDNHIIFSAPGSYNQFDLVVVSKNCLKEKKNASGKFVAALLQAEKFMKNHPEEAAQIVSDKLGSSKDAIQHAWKGAVISVSLDHALITVMEDISRWAINEKIVDVKRVPNFLDAIHFNALEKESPESVTVRH